MRAEVSPGWEETCGQDFVPLPEDPAMRGVCNSNQRFIGVFHSN